jgi:hypothetical protein
MLQNGSTIGFHLRDSRVAEAFNIGIAKLRISVNPAFSKVNDKSFRFLSSFESIRQRFNRMGTALAVDLPSDFRAGAPKFAALLKSRVGDDQPIVVKQVCHLYLRLA